MLLVMGVTLYTSRVILNALGFDDFGLYNVIGGIVSLFVIISGSLSAAISRFLTYELGTGNDERLSKVFSNAVIIQIFLCSVVILLGSTVGVWFISAKMQIPNDNYVAAYWVFGFSIPTFCINLLSVPYNAALIAHERMAIFSYVSIIEVVLKLGVAFLINLFASGNRLIFYALLLFGVSAIIQILYFSYCRLNFFECKSPLRVEKSMFKEIGKLAGWNFIGAASGVMRNQGNNVILNLFYGTIVNAAYGICMQVSNAVNQLSDNFMIAVNPQITKSYAQGDIDDMNKLVLRSAKLSFILCWLISIVILFNTQYILQLWLGNVPEYTATLVKLVLVLLLSESVSKPLITAMLATGNIRNYQLIVGGLQMLNLPISYIALRFNMAPPAVLIIAIVISQLCLIARIILLREMVRLNIILFIKEVYIRSILTIAICLPIGWIVKYMWENVNLGIFVIESLISLCAAALISFMVILNRVERDFIIEKSRALIHRFY